MAADRVTAIQEELTTGVCVSISAHVADELVDAIASAYDDVILPAAYEVAGPDPESRRAARDAAFNLLSARVAQALQDARSAAEEHDHGA